MDRKAQPPQMQRGEANFARWQIMSVIGFVAGCILIVCYIINKRGEASNEKLFLDSVPAIAQVESSHRLANGRKGHSSQILTETSSLSAENIPAIANGTLTPDVAKVLLGRSNTEIKNSIERAKITSLIIGALCRSGYADDAWSMIEPGSGIVRETQISGYFAFSRLPLDNMIRAYNELDNEREKQGALVALLQSRPGEFANYDFEELSLNSRLEQRSVEAAFAGILGSDRDNGTKRALIDKAVELTASGKIDSFSLIQILGHDKTQDVFSQWSMMDSKSHLFKEADIDKVRAGLTRRLVEEDFDRAISLICSDPSTKYSYPVISSAVQEMYKIDSAKANEWVTSHANNVDAATAQRIYAVLAQEANRGGDFETSRKWADQVLNPDVRKELIKQIEERQPKNPIAP